MLFNSNVLACVHRSETTVMLRLHFLLKTASTLDQCGMRTSKCRSFVTSIQCESKKVAPLKLFAIFSLVVNLYLSENYLGYCPNI